MCEVCDEWKDRNDFHKFSSFDRRRTLLIYFVCSASDNCMILRKWSIENSFYIADICKCSEPVFHGESYSTELETVQVLAADDSESKRCHRVTSRGMWWKRYRCSWIGGGCVTDQKLIAALLAVRYPLLYEVNADMQAAVGKSVFVFNTSGPRGFNLVLQSFSCVSCRVNSVKSKYGCNRSFTYLQSF